jgi:hypothetical protein
MSEISEIVLLYSNEEYIRGQLILPQEIMEFETLHNIRLPDDVKEFFQIANGVEHNSGFYGIYSLAKWVTSNNHPIYDPLPQDFLDKEKYFVIGHYDICAWNWLIRLDADRNMPTPVIVTFTLDGRFLQVAKGFAEFLHIFCVEGAEDLLR